MEKFGFNSGAGAGQGWVLVQPGGVRGQVALRRSYLVDPPSQELPQAHESVRGEGGGILVVWGCGCILGPVLEEHVPSAGQEGLVGFFHGLAGGYVRSG